MLSIIFIIALTLVVNTALVLSVVRVGGSKRRPRPPYGDDIRQAYDRNPQGVLYYEW